MRTLRRRAAGICGPLLACFLFASLPLPVLAVEAAPLHVEEVPTNLGLAHSMANQVARSTLAELAARIDGRFQAVPQSEHSGNGILGMALDQAARERGYTVLDASTPAAQRLEFRILELRIAYTGVDRSAFMTGKEIERHGACVLACRLVATDSGETLATSQQEVMLADRFDYDLLELVASTTYPFTAPELKERDWSKSTEPFVVTGMIAGLIYLFFSNQSSN